MQATIESVEALSAAGRPAQIVAELCAAMNAVEAGNPDAAEAA